MWCFLLQSLKKIHNKGFEDFVTYLTTRPLCYDLANVVDPFLPQHVCEFYYTCTYYDTGVTISTIRDGEHTISMYVTDVRRALHLPIQNEYFPLPSMDECHVVLEKLNYDFNAQDNSNVLRIYLPTTWKFLTCVLRKCLTNIMRSLDQMNSFEQHILFSIIKNKKLDFPNLSLIN